MSTPRRKKSARADARQKNHYNYILGHNVHLVETQNLDAQEHRLANHPDKLLIGGRRATDQFMGKLYVLWKSLSAREQQVLMDVCEGLSDAEIARHLKLSVSTVKSYLQHVFNKVGVRNRRQLMVRFADFNFPRNPPPLMEE